MKNDCLYYLAAAVLGIAWMLTPAKTEAAKRSLNLSFDGEAEHCSDMKVRSNGEVARAADVFTLQKSEAPILEVSGIERGIFRVRGWDRPEYSVEACKVAAAEDRASAEQMVRSISVTRGGGRFSASGPATDDANWEVYFIVHAPKNANLDLESKNGPISLSDVNGTIKVRATNGPVSVSECSGITEVHTTNGPISFSGGGGEAHLIAQNGPISLRLSGEIWNGSQLEARTNNGPVSLSIADTFRSGIRVETSGRSPISCSAGACNGAFTDRTSNQRTIQLNGSADTVRVSTENGPVSVSGANKTRKII